MTEGAATCPWAETCHLVPPGATWLLLVHSPTNNCHRGSSCLRWGVCVCRETFTEEMRVKGGEKLETASETPAHSWPPAHLPKMLRSTGSRSSTWVVNTATAATQMSRDRARPYRALCTPAREKRGPSAGLRPQRGTHSPLTLVVQRCGGHADRHCHRQLCTLAAFSHMPSLNPHFFICERG